jgi:hypothetical protein
MYFRSRYGNVGDKRRAELTLITVFCELLVVLLYVMLALAGLVLVQSLVPLSLCESHSNVFDAPDEESATAYMLEIGSWGAVRSTLLRAYDREEMSGIIERLGPSEGT